MCKHEKQSTSMETFASIYMSIFKRIPSLVSASFQDIGDVHLVCSLFSFPQKFFLSIYSISCLWSRLFEIFLTSCGLNVLWANKAILLWWVLMLVSTLHPLIHSFILSFIQQQLGLAESPVWGLCCGVRRVDVVITPWGEGHCVKCVGVKKDVTTDLNAGFPEEAVVGSE